MVQVVNLRDNNNQTDVANINIKLFPHQKAIIHEMRKLETNSQTNILSSNVGSGKSYAILAVILLEKRKQGKSQNILVVPNNIYTQWINYIKTFSKELTYKTFIHYGDITELYHRSDILHKVDILITTSVYFNTIATTLRDCNLSIDRVILDEVDSISFFTQIKIPCKKVWLISATADLMSSENAYKSIAQNEIKVSKEFIEKSINLPPITYLNYKCFNKNISFLRHIVNRNQQNSIMALDYSEFKFNFLPKAQIVTSLDELVKNFFNDYKNEISFKESEIQKFLKTFPNHEPMKIIFLLKKHLSEDIELLQEEHVSKVTNYLLRLKELEYGNPQRAQLSQFLQMIQNENIVDVKGFIALLNTPSMLLPNEQLHIDNMSVLILQYRKTIKLLDDKINMIVERLDIESCPICMDDFSDEDVEKIVSACCKNAFCVTCIQKLNKPKKCPSCRALLDESKLITFKIEKPEIKEVVVPVVVPEAPEVQIPEESVELYEFQNNNSDKDVVVKSIINDLRQSKDSRLLIFSDYQGSFNFVRNYLLQESLPFGELCGNIGAIDKTIKDYTDGTIKILMVDSRSYGSGLNLAMTTDIILLHSTERKSQIIGRAHRVPRTISLNVHELLYADEI